MISIVVSVFNEESILEKAWKSIKYALSHNNIDAEVIFVDDGSTDSSLRILNKIKENEPDALKIINFTKNFGHESAMIAGIDHAAGDCIICMDADMQHPPGLIPEMLEKYNEGFHIVNMIREKREDNSWLKNKLSTLFYRFINKLSEYELHENASDFFLISKDVAQTLRNDFRERNRFLRGFIQIVGFEKTTISFIAPVRIGGESKYSFLKLLKLSANAVVSFSKTPLYLGIYIGMFFALFSVILTVYSIYVYFFGDTPPSGYTTLVLFMSISFTILFFLVGIIGIYVGYNFDENKKRPLYIIKKIY
ncbi:MAG: glycosyltransferase family 2 protein [Prolixibacteraceae bacterium]|jgi:glycosyltransferase involved in cell wall biosynthesis|nr:glycosyltransferase family 2 protein [Prolixibacteraceae bacterium]